MVRLTRIYTRTGDTGTTHLADNSVIDKADHLIEALGAVQEAGAVVGVARAALVADPVPDAAPRLGPVLQQVAGRLFDVGADLATPLADHYSYPPVRIQAADVTDLEAHCDEASTTLEPLSSFVLPGGGPAAVQLHLAAAVVRRAERAAWCASAQRGLDVPGGLNSQVLRYLNRLADLLFILARLAASPHPEELWHPKA